MMVFNVAITELFLCRPITPHINSITDKKSQFIIVFCTDCQKVKIVFIINLIKNNGNTENLHKSNLIFCYFKQNLRRKDTRRKKKTNMQSTLNRGRVGIDCGKENTRDLVLITKYHFPTKHINKKTFQQTNHKQLLLKPLMIAYSKHCILKEHLASSKSKE